MPAPDYGQVQLAAEGELIRKRYQLGKTPGRWQMISPASNGMIFKTIEAARAQRSSQSVISEHEARKILTAGQVMRRSNSEMDASPVPTDKEELATCEVTAFMAPTHLKRYLIPVLREWRAMLLGDPEENTAPIFADADRNLIDIFYSDL